MSTTAYAEAEIEAIVREVELYVSRHPTAADTTEGIARWWLDRREQPALSNVESALELLVVRGVLTSRLLPGGKSFYSAALRSVPPRPTY